MTRWLGVVLLFLAACGRSSQSLAVGGRGGFVLADVRYGRLHVDAAGERLVSPMTTVDRDPMTGATVPGSLVPLDPGIDPEVPQSIGLGPSFLPPVIPRDGALELEFTAPVDAASIVADEIDGSGALSRDGSIQLRHRDGTPVAVTLELVDPTTVRLVPLAGAPPSFPPSPVDFGPDGEPRVDSTGHLRLVLPRAGGAVVRSMKGVALHARVDRLGDPEQPIGLNPGNRVLDFAQFNSLIPTNETFNGFLPDLTPPRVIRHHRLDRTFAPDAGDDVAGSTVTLAGAAFSTLARGGRGE
jgi:hypothetical protein